MGTKAQHRVFCDGEHIPFPSFFLSKGENYERFDVSHFFVVWRQVQLSSECGQEEQQIGDGEGIKCQTGVFRVDSEDFWDWGMLRYDLHPVQHLGFMSPNCLILF